MPPSCLWKKRTNSLLSSFCWVRVRTMRRTEVKSWTEHTSSMFSCEKKDGQWRVILVFSNCSEARTLLTTERTLEQCVDSYPSHFQLHILFLDFAWVTVEINPRFSYIWCKLSVQPLCSMLYTWKTHLIKDWKNKKIWNWGFRASFLQPCTFLKTGKSLT